MTKSNKNLKLWELDKDNFELIDDVESHCINTNFYDIPLSHPDLYGMAKRDSNYKDDSIMTRNYKHKHKNNNYSYQKKTNIFYSESCYYYLRLGVLNSDYFKRPWAVSTIKKFNQIPLKILNDTQFTEIL